MDFHPWSTRQDRLRYIERVRLGGHDALIPGSGVEKRILRRRHAAVVAYRLVGSTFSAHCVVEAALEAIPVRSSTVPSEVIDGGVYEVGS